MANDDRGMENIAAERIRDMGDQIRYARNGRILPLSLQVRAGILTLLAILFLMTFSTFRTASAATITYTYDVNGRLLKADYGNGKSITYTYDAAGNKLSKASVAQRNALTVTLTGSGSVTSSPPGISCGDTCSASFVTGTSVTLSASPNMGYVFSGWSGGCTGVESCVVAMDGDKNVTATFTADSTPPATSPSLQAGDYTGIQTVTLAANEAATIYYTIDGSDPVGSGTRIRYTGPITLKYSTILKYYAVDRAGNSEEVKTAVYTISGVYFTLNVVKSGSGTITSSVSGIDCGPACSASFSSGTRMTLTAAPGSGYAFSNWSGDCTGTDPVCTIFVDDTKNVTAAFIPVVSFSGTIKYSSNLPMEGASIQVLGSQTLTTTSSVDGSFTLSGIPANRDFVIKITKPDFLDVYSAVLNLSQDKAAPTPYVLYGTGEVALWQPYYQSFRGMIRGKVINKYDPGQAISGATVTCTTTSGSCRVVYSNGAAFGGTSTFFNGIYMVWDLEDNAQVTITAVKPGWTFSSPRFTAHANSIGEGPILAAPPGSEETISLTPGWNFISFPQLPSSPAPVDTVFGGLSANLRIVWGYDNANKTWLKYSPSASTPTLTSIEFGKGYWVYMSREAFINMTAWAPPASARVNLTGGWNLIGYHGTNNKDITNGLGASVDGRWILLWTWEGDRWFGKHAALTLPVDPLTSLSHGRAYWIKVNSDGDWTQ